MTVDARVARTAVVTGAGGTLGRAVVRRLVAAGDAVLAVDRSAEALTGLGPSVHTFIADVTQPDQVAAYARAGADLGGGGVDLFVNNAGVEGVVAPVERVDLDDVRQVFEVNVFGVLLGMRHVLPLVRPGGSVVVTGSTASLHGSPGAVAYVASKHAALGIARTAALEVAHRGIRVNAVCPGPVAGRMMDSLDEQRGEVLGGGFVPDPDGRSDPDEVAAVVEFLLSDRARLVNGEAVPAVRTIPALSGHDRRHEEFGA